MDKFIENHLKMIGERESVLNEIERTVFTGRYKLSKKHLEIFSVQSISMIYSIWEGFIQISLKEYIQYLDSLHNEFWALDNNIVIFHMENKFKQFFDYPQKKEKKINFYDQLFQHYKSDVVSLFNTINTESNVSFEVLNKLLKQFALEPFPEAWEIYRYPNSNLKEIMNVFLRYRNSVAHGGDISSEEKVTQEVYEKYKKLIIDLMYGVNSKLSNALNNRTYLKIDKRIVKYEAV